MAKKVGVILSGCGVQDGSEIHEAVCTMLALDRAGAEMVIMAPDKPQADVVDHRTGKAAKEKRNVLAESARIARGDIHDIKKVKPEDLDAVILPGGFGAAKNLSNFATAGVECTVDDDVAALLRKIHAAGKPIAALCIAPAVISRVFGEELGPELTIGKDQATAKALEAMGAKHFDTDATDVLIDEANRIITTPCYMLAGNISEVAIGAEKAVNALLAMSESRTPAMM